MDRAADRERAWAALAEHRRAIGDLASKDVLVQDPGRVQRFTHEACGLVVDLSKHLVESQTFDLLVDLARASDLEARRDALLSGAIVNETEGRPALHTALRNRSAEPVLVGGTDVMPEVRHVLSRMRAFCERVRSGAWTGFTGRPLRDVVNIGIGGSDLGPAMVATALDAWRSPTLRGHYVSNLDAAHLEGVLRDLDAETTLFVVVSKTFSTQETLANAHRARHWLIEELGSERAVSRHFVAVSTHRDRVQAFGIDPANMFEFWDWVGGRYSLWSAVGLSVALLVGMDAFEALLAGAFEMDRHFREAPLEENLPVLLGLLGVWYADLWGMATHAVLPYDWALRLLPAHLQQLEMESNGKRVHRDGTPVERPTCPVVWGGPGNNGQHAYYQLLHQGTQVVPVDVLVAAESQAAHAGHQAAVLANALAQAAVLFRGRSAEAARRELEAAGLTPPTVRQLAAHKTMPGGRPSTTILYRRLSPEILGAIVALYEHKVFSQSVVWDVNPFDQWGVELGKRLASELQRMLEGPETVGDLDASTAALLARIRAWRT